MEELVRCVLAPLVVFKISMFTFAAKEHPCFVTREPFEANHRQQKGLFDMKDLFDKVAESKEKLSIVHMRIDHLSRRNKYCKRDADEEREFETRHCWVGLEKY